MIAGFPPFNQADIRGDLYYKALVRRPEIYFKKTAERRGGMPFSQALKDLLTGMLNPVAEDRLTLEQVIDHPWTKGPEPNV
jgi:serine/threonine protein kinase